MNAAILVALCLLAFLLGYQFYGKILSQKVFKLDEQEGSTPAQQFNDNSDYSPAKASILWGHHFSSIAGAAPIVGPAVAIIWGWLPALLWIVLGTIFMGAAHDFGALVISMKNRGLSLATISGDLISSRVRNLLLIVILFLVWMVIAVFALVIANLFVSFPSSVIPVNFEIFVALFIGYFINRRGKNILVPAIVAQGLLFFMIHLGSLYPVDLSPYFDNPLLIWILFLLGYSFIASILPVWALLQPRDYINSHQLLIGLIGIILGVLFLQPQVVAPVIQANPSGAPSWFPFLFITIACGAISGFHGLVSAGTSSKQVAHWKDAKVVGYGGMIGEGTLAVLATLAVSAGFLTESDWHAHYGSWDQAKGLSASINAFVMGTTRFLNAIGIPEDFAATMMAVLIISFAATSLDTATRIQRYIISEVGEFANIRVLKASWGSAGLAVLSAMFLMFIESSGKGGLILWPLFGATNQMLAALTMIIICAYLISKKESIRNYFFPLIFLLVVTTLGLVHNFLGFIRSHNYLLSGLTFTLLIIEVWITIEAWQIFYSKSSTKKNG